MNMKLNAFAIALLATAAVQAQPMGTSKITVNVKNNHQTPMQILIANEDHISNVVGPITQPGTETTLQSGQQIKFTFDAMNTRNWEFLIRACEIPVSTKLHEPDCSDFAQTYICRFDSTGIGAAGVFNPTKQASYSCSATNSLGSETTYSIG